jgi:hypothetical protein
MEKYTKRLREISGQKQYIQECGDAAKKNDATDDEEYYKGILENLSFQVQHLDIQIEALEHYSNADVIQDVTQDYIFDWTYNPARYDVRHSKEEKLNIAKDELRMIANTKIAALAASGVKAHVCNQGEILDMCRRLFQPIASEQLNIYHIKNSSYYDDIVGSDTKEYLNNIIEEQGKDSTNE